MEERHLLSATPFDVSTLADEVGAASLMNAAPLVIGKSAPPPPNNHGTNQAIVAGGAGVGSPYPLEQTFSLHSLPGATKKIYLDLDGFVTRNTQWNTDFNTPNIITPAYSLDDDFLNFSDEEKGAIQFIWERIAEDFRPFEVDVTTEDPGVEALRKVGAGDEEWGIRVVIGGNENDWFDLDPGLTAGGVAYLTSFSYDSDTPCFIFAGDAPFDLQFISDGSSHEIGHTLGLVHDSQFVVYSDTSKMPPETVRQFVQYYKGHGTGDTSWAPIMGNPYTANLTQWSFGEYFNATNDAAGNNPLQDDLEVITNRNGTNDNGTGYRIDDHGDAIATASSVVQDTATADLDTSLFTGEGIIERNTDIDFFSFEVEGLGELISLDIQPFYNGPNLDVLAKLYNSSGAVIATGNSIDELGATFTDLALLPGTYYVSIQGDGRPITFIDPMFHPGPIEFDPTPDGAMLPPDTSDWGYSNYGSLGYYSIAGIRKKGLVVGVDFDVADGTSPLNWGLFSGGGQQTVLTNLKSETGLATPYDLTIRTTGTGFEGLSSGPINSGQVPDHALPLDDVDGYISTASDTWTFVWSDLQPSAVYQVYVFDHAGTSVANHVTIVGGEWNGVTQTYDFTQTVSPNDLVVNDNAPSSNSLSTLTLFVIADASGKITINVKAEADSTAGLAGLAIAPTKVGSFAGQKWNDQNGDGTKDPGEGGLPNWLIYLDLNNDGILNSTSDLEVTQASPDVPQPIVDYTTKKSELFFTEVGEIVDVDVTLNIAHTFDADLSVYLISPLGTRVKLFSDIGGTNDNFTNTTLDDEASTAITSAAAPFTGRFRPEANITPSELAQFPNAKTTLSAFDGQNSSGTWRLEITDNAAGDTGALLGWSLTVKLAGVFLEPFTMTDAGGNYSFTDLPPGLYHVREQIQENQILEGWKATWTPPPVTVRSGSHVNGIDFGNWIPVSVPGSIAGQTWNDLNGDGVKDEGEPGLPGWTVYIDSDNDGVLDTGTTSTIASTDVPKSIADFSNVQSRVLFSGLGKVAKVVVTLDISHSFVGDLDAFLVSPSGTSVELFTGVGGQYNDLQNLTLDDGAARSIATIGFSDVPYSGTWRPEGHLSDVIGEDATGNWTLVVRDTAFADTGTLNSWSITITVGELSTETDENGNYLFENLPPGTYLIREQQQSGWTRTFPTGDGSWQVTIGGGNATGKDFGNHQMQILLGDYDQSGVVDLADYVVWRKAMGTNVTPGSGADGNGDGKIDQDDLAVWRAHFGQSLPGAGGASAGDVAAVVESPASAAAESAVAQPEPLALTAPASVASVAEVHVAEVQPALQELGDTSSPSAAGVETVQLMSQRSAPQARSAFSTASPARSAASSDAAILAWLTMSARVDRHAAANDVGIAVSDDSADDSRGEPCDHLDVVFAAIGTRRASLRA